jgi:hypothetical protein
MNDMLMKKEWLIKTLALGIVVLFIGISCSSAISVDTKTSVINNQNIENKSYVDPNIHLTKTNLPMLKRSFNYFRNSNFYDVEIGKVMEQIIKLIEFKGSVNSEDVENILINSDVAPIDIYTDCKIVGNACAGHAITIPLLFLSVITLFFLFFGIGGILFWNAHYPRTGWCDIEITVGSWVYKGEHNGYAFGFFGWGYREFNVDPYFEDELKIVRGHASIVFVRT